VTENCLKPKHTQLNNNPQTNHANLALDADDRRRACDHGEGEGCGWIYRHFKCHPHYGEQRQPVHFASHDERERYLEKILAKSCITSLSAIAKMNPNLDTNQPVPVGEKVQIPCTPEIPSFPPSGENTPPAGQASLIPIFTTEQAGNLDPKKSSGGHKKPHRSSVANGQPERLVLPCSPSRITRRIESGVLHLPVGDLRLRSDWPRWGPNNKASFLFPRDPIQKSGLLRYYAASFNAAGETPSNLVPVPLRTAPVGRPPTPRFNFDHGILTILPISTGLTFTSLACSHLPWQRACRTGECILQSGAGQRGPAPVPRSAQATARGASGRSERWGLGRAPASLPIWVPEYHFRPYHPWNTATRPAAVLGGGR